MTNCLRTITIALLLLIVQTTSAGYDRTAPITWRWHFGETSGVVNAKDKPYIPLPDWLLACDSVNRILYASLFDEVITHRWGNVPVSDFRSAYFFLEANPEYVSRNPLISLYQATESITFLPNFETADGDEFVAEIVSDPGIPGGPNSNMNWILSKSFDENGNIINENKQFFDNGGRPLQTQSKIKHRYQDGTTTTQVMATQPLRDALGRSVAQTMPAPINNSDFLYKPDFVQNTNGGVYNYINFDRYNPSGSDIDKTNSPDPVGGQNTPGTLGWYYSSNNTWEPYTATTNYPYSRQTIFRDGSGRPKKSGGTGEVFKTGSGHEASTVTAPVVNELNHYLQVRNRFFTTGELGAEPTNLKSEAVQTISQDANGKEFITIQDKTGKPVMSARPGSSGLSINNSITLTPVAYRFTVPKGDTYGGYAKIKIVGNGYAWISQSSDGVNFTQIFEGDMLAYAPPDRFTQYMRIESDQPFNMYYAMYDADDYDGYPGCEGCAGQYLGTEPGNSYYFKLFNTSTVTVTGGSYELYNMTEVNEPQVTGFSSGGSLNAGLYKLLTTSKNSVTLTYSNTYTDICYTFYNQLGKTVAIVAPEGVNKLLGSGLNNYTVKTDVPFISLNEYDVQGRLIKTISIDGGTSELVYRKDGKIRFSQNAEQKLSGRYSYTNYDQFGRPVESGEYQPDGGGIQFNSDLTAATNPMRDILENTSSTGGLTTGTKTDVITTLYDITDNTHGLSGYTQDPSNLGNAVSMTRKYSSIVNNTPNSANIASSTWYNYDEEGRLTWMIRYINDLGYKTTDYSYDFQGRVTKKVFQKNTAAETFVHYYEYDPVNKKIWKVYTNTVDNVSTRQLQATYVYYLHGPIKRIELATDLQGIDYIYTLQGKLKAINNSDKTKDPSADGSNSINPDAFGMVLDYFPGDYQNNRTSGVQQIKGVNTAGIGSDSYTGNIKAMTWFSRKPSFVTNSIPGIEDPTTYVYQYDEKYQFTESTWGTGINFGNTPATFTSTALNKETVKQPSSGTPAYDANGNILFLQRTGTGGAPTESFTYNYLNSSTGTGSNTNYNTNKLQSVINDASGTPQTYASYIYDKLGQLTVESSGGGNAKYIKYDVTGKVVLVARDAAFTQKVVEYVYDELGARIMKKSYNVSFQLSEITYYADDVIYTRPVSGGTPGAVTAQEYEITSGGRLGVYFRQSNIYAYELNDHLGNVRAIVAKNGSTMEVRMYTDYYPYGTVIRQYNSPEGYRYEYQGRYAEKDKETDWNAFELRMYDSRIGRWLSVDPEGQYWSPYIGMGNDPVNNTDPDGGFTGPEDRAKAYAKTIDKSRDPVAIPGENGNWFVNQTIPDGNIITKVFKPSYLERIWAKAGKWWDETSFVTDVKAKVTFGAQIGISGKLYGVLEGKIEGGAQVYEVADAKLDIAHPTHSDANLGEKRVHNFIGIEGGLAKSDLRVGLKYDYNYAYYNGYSGPTKTGDAYHDWSITIPGKKFGNPVKIVDNLVKTQVKRSMTVNHSKEKTFYGIDLGAGAKLLLGVELKLRIGIER
jgi:RHS repeat-associated protein